MARILFPLLLLVFSVYAQQKQIAIINTVDDGEPSLEFLELNHLTDKLREIAHKILPQKSYAVMTQQSIVSLFATQEDMIIACSKAEGCLVKIGREIAADYICQGRIGRFGKDYTIKVELYESVKGTLVSSFTGNAKDIYGLLAILNEKTPDLFRDIQVEPIKEIKEDAIVLRVTKGSLTDKRDGKVYKTVKIGAQNWMAENLSYDTKGSKCYDNKSENCVKYGRLYDWSTAMKVCPNGWHLPGNDEWQKLVDLAGGNNFAGEKLKAKNGWGTIKNSDDYGFSALPGGAVRSYLRFSFHSAGYYGHWWSSTKYDKDEKLSYNRSMSHLYESVDWGFDRKQSLLSVRCVKSL
ncbi:MAG: fibrobacter succinogenes major paralogous domain-containing protein [Fibromonadales bacterium]|nr:fibrobacter succinogenes major paralogous domain-containing protein [Fibromonadales bacterium]